MPEIKTIGDLKKGDKLNLPGVGVVDVSDVKHQMSLMNGSWIRDLPVTSVIVDKDVFAFTSRTPVTNVERKNRVPDSQPLPKKPRAAKKAAAAKPAESTTIGPELGRFA